MNPEKKKFGLIGGLIIAILLAIPLYKIAAPFLMPIFLGAVLAMISRPLYLWLTDILNKRKKSAAAITTLLIVLIVVAPAFAIIWYAAKDALSFLQEGAFVESIRKWLDGGALPLWFSNALDWLADITRLDRNQIESEITELVKSAGINTSQIIGSWLAGIPQLLLLIFITIISTFYLFIDGEKATHFISSITPLTNTQQTSIYNAFESMCRAVVIGTIAAAMVQGGLVGLLFLIFSVPQALFFTIVAVFFAMIPFIGTSPVWIGGAIYLLINHHPLSAVAMVIAGLFIGIMDNVIKPWVMSGQSNLHPLLVLISVIGGLAAFGLTGIFLGPILMGVFVSVLRIVAQMTKLKSA